MNMKTEVAYAYSDQPSMVAVLTESEEQALLLAYLPLVKRIVKQLSLQASQSFDRDDMEQVGLMGLLEALRRYGCPDANFGAFAKLRVRGAILDELRRLDWRPRQVRQNTHKIRDAVRELTRKLGRMPEDKEIITYTGVSKEEYWEFCQSDACEAMESLDEILLAQGDHLMEDQTSVEDQQVNEKTLEKVLAQLTEREQLILTLYYQHELSLKEIALVLELTDARVCQLCKQAIAKASKYLVINSAI